MLYLVPDHLFSSTYQIIDHRSRLPESCTHRIRIVFLSHLIADGTFSFVLGSASFWFRVLRCSGG